LVGIEISYHINSCLEDEGHVLSTGRIGRGLCQIDPSSLSPSCKGVRIEWTL
jgi:hypothetical protein